MLISKFWFDEVSNRGVLKHTKEVFSSFLKPDNDNRKFLLVTENVCVRLHPELLIAINFFEINKIIKKIITMVFESLSLYWFFSIFQITGLTMQSSLGKTQL